MTERTKPAQQLASAREILVAELDKAQQARANAQAELEIKRGAVDAAAMRIEALMDALNALGPAPTRKRRANGAAAPKRGRTQPAQPALIPAAD